MAGLFVTQRNYAKAEEIVQSIEETAKTHNAMTNAMTQGEQQSPNIFMRGFTLERLGRIARFRGDKEKARANFEAARSKFEEWLGKKPQYNSPSTLWVEAHSLAYIAEIDAALGHKEDAIREARNAVERWPNGLLAPNIQALLAIVYVWTGERDAAFSQLAGLVKLPAVPSLQWWACPAAVTAGELKLNPIWDELRNDPRFDKIVAQAAKPIKLD